MWPRIYPNFAAYAFDYDYKPYTNNDNDDDLRNIY